MRVSKSESMTGNRREMKMWNLYTVYKSCDKSDIALHILVLNVLLFCICEE